MRPRPAQWLAAALVLFAASAAAQPLGYGAGFNELYRLDLATGQATKIGPIGFNDVEGLAISPSGVLYGVADASMLINGQPSATTDFLFHIDTGTGAGTLIGQLPGLQGLGPTGNLDFGLAFTCDGRLWLAAETTGDLWEVNPATAALRAVGNTGATLSGLAGRGNQLYGVSVDPQPRLYRIDPATGQALAVGPLNVGGQVRNAGLDFDAAGVLWATLDSADLDPSRVVRVDLQSGQGTVIGNVTLADIGFKGLAIASPAGCAGGGGTGTGGVPPSPTVVPGPGTPALLLLIGLAGAFGVGRIRRRNHDW